MDHRDKDKIAEYERLHKKYGNQIHPLEVYETEEYKRYDQLDIEYTSWMNRIKMNQMAGYWYPAAGKNWYRPPSEDS